MVVFFLILLFALISVFVVYKYVAIAVFIRKASISIQRIIIHTSLAGGDIPIRAINSRCRISTHTSLTGGDRGCCGNAG